MAQDYAVSGSAQIKVVSCSTHLAVVRLCAQMAVVSCCAHINFNRNKKNGEVKPRRLVS